MDLQCILCIANSSYAFKTPKEEVTYIYIGIFTKHWKFGNVSLKAGDFEIKREDRRQPLKTGVSRSKREGRNIWCCCHHFSTCYLFTPRWFYCLFYLLNGIRSRDSKHRTVPYPTFSREFSENYKSTFSKKPFGRLL